MLEKAWEGMRGYLLYITNTCSHITIKKPHNIDTIQRYTNSQTQIHVCACVCGNIKTQQEVAIQGWTQADVNENDGNGSAGADICRSLWFHRSK